MNPAKRQRLRYDVFISYSHRNKEWVRGWLVPQLKNAELKVCIDHESFEPGAPSITEMERAVLQSRTTVLVLTPEYLQSEWTEFENILVQTLDPAAHQRRLLPVLLVRCELPLRIGILTYLDFTRSAEHTERVKQLITAIRCRLAAGRKSKTVPAVSLPFSIPTGKLSSDSPLYIERNHDHLVRQLVIHEGSTIIIEGARQMGKSSLLARAVAHARLQQCTIVDFNFQALDEQCLESLQTLLRYLADAIYERLQVVASPDETWKGPLGAKDKLTSFICNHVLQGACMPVVVVMDEVDRVFGRPYQDDFFGLLRFWHDQRASDPLLGKLNLVLAYSTDPRQAIKDPNQSPFNVGTKIQLADFTPDEVWELNRRYERPLKRKDQLQSLVDVIGGHPYLAQQALYALAAHRHTLPSLLNVDNTDVGPFADHLHHYWHLFESEPTLRQGIRQVITNGNCSNYAIFSRLRSLGLIAGISHNDAKPRCRLYAMYFQRVLS
jgi:hypothetical protein